MTKEFTLTKEEAVGIYRNQTNLARALGITRASVSLWKAGRPIPQKQALRIRYELRPDLWE